MCIWPGFSLQKLPANSRIGYQTAFNAATVPPPTQKLCAKNMLYPNNERGEAYQTITLRKYRLFKLIYSINHVEKEIDHE